MCGSARQARLASTLARSQPIRSAGARAVRVCLTSAADGLRCRIAPARKRFWPPALVRPVATSRRFGARSTGFGLATNRQRASIGAVELETGRRSTSPGAISMSRPGDWTSSEDPAPTPLYFDPSQLNTGHSLSRLRRLRPISSDDAATRQTFRAARTRGHARLRQPDSRRTTAGRWRPPACRTIAMKADFGQCVGSAANTLVPDSTQQAQMDCIAGSSPPRRTQPCYKQKHFLPLNVAAARARADSALLNAAKRPHLPIMAQRAGAKRPS